MLRRHLITIISIVMVCLATTVSVAAPAVKNVTPAAVTLQAGKSTTVELNGQRLNQARKAVVIGPRDTRPVRGITAKLQRGPAAKRALILRAGKNARAGTYRVMLTGNGKVILPLSVQIAKATAKQVPKSSVNKNTSLAQSRGQSNANLTAKSVPTQTPIPTMTEGNPCSAVVTYSWNVSNDFPNASGVRWELKKDSNFQNPNGQEPSRLASQYDSGTSGSVTIDLRDHGQVLNGTEYYFRIAARGNGNDLALRSSAVVYGELLPEDFGYTPISAVRNPGNDYGVTLGWALPQQVTGCSDHAFYEIKKGSPFFNRTGVEQNRVASGSLNGTSGSTNINIPNNGPGAYSFRVFGKYGGNDVENDVGPRGGSLGSHAMGLPTSALPDVSLTINNGASTSSNANVTVKLTIASPPSWAWTNWDGFSLPYHAEYRIFQPGGPTPNWSTVSQYASPQFTDDIPFTLTGSAGNKTLTVEVRVTPLDINMGYTQTYSMPMQTISASDTILWTASAPAGVIKPRPKNIQNTLDLDPRLRPPN